jgi:hypothetical protein
MDIDRDIFDELQDIGRMLTEASVISNVRKAVAAVKKHGCIVTDGRHHMGGDGYEVVVQCRGDVDAVARRIRSKVPDMDVERIADNVLGLKAGRRGRVDDGM